MLLPFVHENSPFLMGSGLLVNNCDHNFMKVVHNDYYHDVFLEFDNGLYGLMPS